MALLLACGLSSCCESWLQVADVDGGGKALPLEPLSTLVHEVSAAIQDVLDRRVRPLLPVLFVPLDYRKILASCVETNYHRTLSRVNDERLGIS